MITDCVFVVCDALSVCEFASMKSCGVVAIATSDPTQDSSARASVAMTTATASHSPGVFFVFFLVGSDRKNVPVS